MNLTINTHPNFLWISPIWSEKVRDKRLATGKAILSEIGREKLCTKCQEFWPSDTEFFHVSKSRIDGLRPWCKACCEEYRKKR